MGGLVPNGVDRVEAEPVDIEGPGEIAEIFEKKMPDVIALGLVEIDGVAPGGPGRPREVGTESAQIVAFRTQMV